MKIEKLYFIDTFKIVSIRHLENIQKTATFFIIQF